MSTKLFVYGTLKRGMLNAHFLDGQTFVAEALTTPCYRMVSLGEYPGMFAVTRDGKAIHGEIWAVDDACKARLDELEGLDDGLYTFERANLAPPWGEAEVWTYLYARDVSGLGDAGQNWRDQ